MRSLTVFALAIFALCMSMLVSTTAHAYKIGPPAPANINVRSSLFNKIAAVVVPIINTYAANITIPGESSDHFNFDSFSVQNFDLGPIVFNFVAPNQVSVQLSQLSFNVPSVAFELKDKIVFVHVHCSGHAHATVNVEASFSFNLDNNNGRIALDGNTAVSVNYKTLDIGYSMDHEACKIISKFINFIIGGITNKIKDAIEKDLAPAVQKALTGALSGAFAKLPFDITGSPNVANQVLSLPIDLDSFIKSQQQTKQQRPPRMLSRVRDSTQDLSVVLPQTSANTVLATVAGTGKLVFNHTEHAITTKTLAILIPGAMAVCPNCPVNLAVSVPANSPPTVSFQNNNFSLSASGFSLTFSAINASRVAPDPLFTLGVTAGFSVANFSVSTSVPEVVHFDLGAQQIQLTVISSAVGPINDVNTISWLVNLIAQTVIPSFNKAFPGVPIPSVDGFTLRDLQVSATGGEFSAGFDVSLV